MSDHEIKMFDKEIRESKSVSRQIKRTIMPRQVFKKYLPALAHHATMWELKWVGNTDCVF